MKTMVVVAVVAAFAAFAWYLLPSPPRADAERALGEQVDPAAASEGVVLAVDRTGGIVTINHGPLRNLAMPPMTMGFEVADSAILDRLKTGDRIRFRADAVGGAFTATGIEIGN